ncbi:MAG TPA: hypothetical protein VF518_05750 [Polyangia bacterium]
MEPRPLLEGAASEIEKALLRAGRADGPRKEAAAQVLAVMQALPAPGLPGLRPSVESGRGHTGSVETAGLVRWVKIVSVAVAIGGAAAVTYQLTRPRGVVPSAMPAIQETTSSEARAPGKASPEVREDLSTAREEEPHLVAGEGNVRRRRASSSGRAREATHEAGDNPLDRSLGNETRALDRAREALDEHRPSEVLRLLDEYQRRFPQGRLRPEAMVLRLAALVQAGKHDAADSLARQLLADEAYQTYAARIRSLLGEAKP